MMNRRLLRATAGDYDYFLDGIQRIDLGGGGEGSGVREFVMKPLLMKDPPKAIRKGLGQIKKGNKR